MHACLVAQWCLTPCDPMEVSIITIANYKMIIIQFLAIDDLGISWVTIFHDERLYPEFPAQYKIRKGPPRWCQCRRVERHGFSPWVWKELMTTHSSAFAWRSPWSEEPGGLQSMELQSQTWLKPLSTHMYHKKDDPIWESNRASVG